MEYRCKKMDELPVTTEWQNAIYCPNCAHYSLGKCCNPTRTSEESKCPFDGKELPLKLVGEDFKYEVGTNVVVETQPGMACNAKIIDRKVSDFGNLYQVDWSEHFKEAKNSPWILEQFVLAKM